MKTLDLRMTLTEPTVLSTTAATTGAAMTSDYIPGGRLLGWVASRLYTRLNGTDAFTLFHSGQVRFNDGLPLFEDSAATLDTVALPVPFCLAWHKEDADARNPALAVNTLTTSLADEPMERAAGGHVEGRNLRSVTAAIDWGRKTAINPKKGRAEEAQLFGYAALRLGQRFLASIEFDDGVAQSLIDAVQNLFPDTIHVGKSRAAEFGAIAVEVLPRDQAPQFRALPSHPPRDDETVLWLLSDLAVPGPEGGYGLVPKGPDVGLTEGHPFDATRSCVRTATYAPFNGAMRARMPQRLVIRRGSVLVFKGTRTSDAAGPILRAGLHQEQGLGRMWVDPAPLRAGEALGDWRLDLPLPASPTETADTPPAYVARLAQACDLDPLGPLIEAEEHAQTLREIYDSARAANGPSSQGGPKASQWNRVRGVVTENADNGEALYEQLFLGNSAVCNPEKNQEEWGCRYAYVAGAHFSGWFERTFFPDKGTRPPDRRTLLLFLRLAADVAREKLDGGSTPEKLQNAESAG